jgi:predicted transcriptional regulator
VPSTTTSIRIPEDLRHRLERTARHLNKGKNWIINQALDEYLRKLDREALIAEARRQSLIASRDAENGDDFWERAADNSGWR